MLPDSKYAIRRKKLLALVKQLRAIGAQADLDLPRIAVIGNQSAGEYLFLWKSSVVEAISGISVPRDAGTCTRCPMECRMSSSDGPWSCRISVRWEFDDLGKPQNSVSEVPFGDVIYDEGEVELALRRAQAAVLHPGTPSTKFLGMSADEIKNMKDPSIPFSRNVVCIDLEGPNLTDLSFIDLPGIIQNAEPTVVKLVEDVVTSNIKGNTIILVALPMTDDIENQKALRLAQEEDSAGMRTIGVLTKPDQVALTSTKARANWIEVLEGRRHPLTHGYYCTRQPDDAERADGVTPAEARAAEVNFFRTTKPWSTTSCPERLGTSNLVGALSEHLVRLISDMLPGFTKSARSGLAAIPPAIVGDPANYMMGLVAEFCRTVEQFVRGGAETGALIQRNREAFAQLKREIRATAPNFRPFIAAAASASATKDFKNALDDGEDEGTEEGLHTLSLAEPFFLDDMRKHIQKSVTRELPNTVPFVSKVVLINEFQKSWSMASTNCVEKIRTTMSIFLHDYIQHRVRHRSLQGFLTVAVNELSAQHYAQCLSRIQEQLEMEQEPFTQNGHYLETCKEKWLAYYKDARAGQTVFGHSTKLSTAATPAPAFTFEKGSASAAAPNLSKALFGPVPGTTANNPANPGANSAALAPTIAATAATPPPAFAFGKGFASTPPNAAKASFGPILGTTATHPASPGATSGARPPIAATTVTPSPSPTPSSKVRQESVKETTLAVLAGLAKLGYTVTEDDLAKLLPSDEYEEELQVMAEVRGYFQVAYKRMIDNIPSLLDHLFVKAIARNLQSFLITKLGIGSSESKDRLAMYLEEDPRIVAQRAELVAKKTRLETVEGELRTFSL
ncbi:P-loop containing nucleoside triphosphate hydrolase protein [Melanogaster broomeanus]|nr:P-loop containing nucleoside triphosphate hydrolase protein [Melanogaster broomeanus]